MAGPGVGALGARAPAVGPALRHQPRGAHAGVARGAGGPGAGRTAAVPAPPCGGLGRRPRGPPPHAGDHGPGTAVDAGQRPPLHQARGGPALVELHGAGGQ
eukprot:3692513-Lingulodinium_polyedra.AAC.1